MTAFPAKPAAFAVDWRPRGDTRSLLNLKSCELQHPAADQLLTEVIAGLSARDIWQYPYQGELVRTLSRSAQVGAESVLLTAGSSSAIAMIVDALAEPAGRLLLQEPAFDVWLYHAALRGVSTVRCTGLTGTPPAVITHDFADALRTGPPSVAVITNPGNPAGIVLPAAHIAQLAELAAAHGHVLVVDECYGAFSGLTHVPLLGRLPNLIVVRSLSKGWALAGARLAVVYGSAELIGYLRRFASDAAVSAPAVALAHALAARAGELAAICADVAAIREEFTAAVLRDHLQWTALPSGTNFVTFSTGVPGTGTRIQSALMKNGIRIRGLDDVAGLAGCVRFSIAHRDQMQRVTDLLRKLSFC
jgi:histidinol-phosphate aminotransferase